jgi:hypothetical protein
MRTTSRLVKKVGHERLLAVRDVLQDIQTILKNDLESLYAEMLQEPSGEWVYRQAMLIGQVKATKNLITLINTGDK